MQATRHQPRGIWRNACPRPNIGMCPPMARQRRPPHPECSNSWKKLPTSPVTLVCSTPIGHSLEMTFTRITTDPTVCTGKPCIRGLRFPVARLLGLLAAGESRERILDAYPFLEAGDIK